MRIGYLAGALALSFAVLVGCGSEKPSAKPAPAAESTVEPDAEPSAAPKKRTQKATCDWGSPRLKSGAAQAPQGQDGELADALIGAWQHTHADKGSGFEPLESSIDVRYVFPSANTVLYCQDVKGATKQAENKAKLQLKGKRLVLPSPAPGYTVMAWDENTMIWKNHGGNNETYLLQRR